MTEPTYQAVQAYIGKADAITAESSELTLTERKALLKEMRDTVKQLGAAPLEKRDADTLRMLNDVADELERMLTDATED